LFIDRHCLSLAICHGPYRINLSMSIDLFMTTLRSSVQRFIEGRQKKDLTWRESCSI
jgi:hypothetical protein